MKRIDQEGPNALLQLREPVNKFPARGGCAMRHAHLRTHRLRVTVALAFALICAIIGAGSTCRSLILDVQRSPSVSYLGIGGTCRRRLFSLCSDARQVGILKHLRYEDAD